MDPRGGRDMGRGPPDDIRGMPPGPPYRDLPPYIVGGGGGGRGGGMDPMMKGGRDMGGWGCGPEPDVFRGGPRARCGIFSFRRRWAEGLWGGPLPNWEWQAGGQLRGDERER